MILLLDTHALLWTLAASARLSATARDAIEDEGNTVLVSIVSAWEIELKRALGRLATPDDLEVAIESAGFFKRPVTFDDVRQLARLPPHHKDPFDRMLIAQARAQGALLVTSEPQISQYSVETLW